MEALDVSKQHKWYDVLIAVMAGEIAQYQHSGLQKINSEVWVDADPRECNPLTHPLLEWRVKPKITATEIFCLKIEEMVSQFRSGELSIIESSIENETARANDSFYAKLELTGVSFLTIKFKKVNKDG